MVYVMEANTTTRMDAVTLDEAVDMITDVDGVREGSRTEVWVTFHCDDGTVQDATRAALGAAGVVVHKVDRREGGLSVALEEYADEL